MVAGAAAEGVVARLGGDDIEDIDRGIAFHNIPLRGIGIVGSCRDGVHGGHDTRPAAGYGNEYREDEYRRNRKDCERMFYSHNSVFDYLCKDTQLMGHGRRWCVFFAVGGG